MAETTQQPQGSQDIEALRQRIKSMEDALRDAQCAFVNQDYTALGEAIYSCGDFYDENSSGKG